MRSRISASVICLDAEQFIRPCLESVRGFLDGIPGLIIALQGAFYAFEKYALLWEALERQRLNYSRTDNELADRRTQSASKRHQTPPKTPGVLP